MTNIRILKKLIPAILTVFILTSCHTQSTAEKVTLSFQGDEYFFTETEENIYVVSYLSDEEIRGTLNYISSFHKNGEKNGKSVQIF